VVIPFLLNLLNEKLIKSSNGPVRKVVKSAIQIIIENISGPSTPRSYPIFRTISSMRPLVFRSAPIDKESFHDLPIILAVNAVPASLPMIATPIISMQNAHKWPSFNKPI